MEDKTTEQMENQLRNDILFASELMDYEKKRLAYKLINLFPNMSIYDAKKLSVDEIEKRIEDKIDGANYHGTIEELQNIIDFLKDKDGSLLPIQNLQEAIENIKKMT